MTVVDDILKALGLGVTPASGNAGLPAVLPFGR